MYASYQERLLRAERQLADARRRQDTELQRRIRLDIQDLIEQNRLMEARRLAIDNRRSPFRQDGSLRPLAVAATSAPRSRPLSEFENRVKQLKKEAGELLEKTAKHLSFYEKRKEKRQQAYDGLKHLYKTKQYKTITKEELSRSGLLAQLSKIPTRQYTRTNDESQYDLRYRILIDDQVNGIAMKMTDFINNVKNLTDGSIIDSFFKTPKKAFMVLESYIRDKMGHTTVLLKNGNKIEYFDANGSDAVPAEVRSTLLKLADKYGHEGFSFNELYDPLQNRGLCARFVFDRILDIDKTLLEYLEQNRGKSRKDVQENIFLRIVRNQRVGKRELDFIEKEIEMYKNEIDNTRKIIIDLRRITESRIIPDARTVIRIQDKLKMLKDDVDKLTESESISDVETAKVKDEDLIDSLIVAQRRAMALDESPLRERADAIGGDDDDDDTDSETVDDFTGGRERLEAVGDDDGDNIQSLIRSLILP
jgi:hypothetical protein